MPGLVLDQAFGSKARVGLLRYMATHEGEFTGRELAARAGVGKSEAASILGELAAAGIVRRRRAGRAFLYSLNSASYAVSDIIKPAYKGEAQWLEAMVHEFALHLKAASQPVESIVLFGSTARGDDTWRSDVDLLVVIPAGQPIGLARPLVEASIVTLSERFGRVPSFLLMDAEEIRRRFGEKDPLVREIVATGRTMAGRSLPEMIASA